MLFYRFLCARRFYSKNTTILLYYSRYYTCEDDDGWNRREFVHVDHGKDGWEKLVSGADQIKTGRRQDSAVDRTEDRADHEKRHDPRNGLKRSNANDQKTD